MTPSNLPTRVLRFATRGSLLARAQTQSAIACIGELPGCTAEEYIIETAGDLDQTSSLAAGDTVGWFTSALERALLAGDAACAVHSAKDLPTDLPASLGIVACLPRGAVEDVAVIRTAASLAALPEGAVVGTSSPRRAAILARIHPHLTAAPIRGNVDTRLRKLDEGEFDAIILARAGLLRLGREEVITEVLDPSVWIPAPGQGIIALEAVHDSPDWELLSAIGDTTAMLLMHAERAVLRDVGGGCAIPLGVLATIPEQGMLHLCGGIVQHEGNWVVREVSGPVESWSELASSLGAALRSA
ncbi:MAG: hydroxymethylbilane synthase [Candidatus Dormibacteria bacterium]